MIGRILRVSTSKSAGQAVTRPAGRDAARLNDPPLDAAEVARFRAIMLPHLDGAYGYARFLCRDPVLAEDLTQEAFLRACRAFRGYRGGEPRAWLFAILRASFLSWGRSPARRETASDSVLDEAVSPDPDPEAALVRGRRVFSAWPTSPRLLRSGIVR